jgi:hypothetical protein
MAYTPFSFPVPDVYAPSFTGGEQALSVVYNANNAPPRTQFAMSQWIVLTAGTHRIKLVAQSAASWTLDHVKKIKSSSGYFSERQILFSSVGSHGVVEREFVVHRGGLKRLNIILQNIQVVAAPCYAIFSVWKSGSMIEASSKATVLCEQGADFIPIEAMGIAPDERLSLPVFSVTPNWKDGVLEKIEYRTDIASSTTDAEQRRMTRLHARRSFEASFLREKSARARLDTFFSGHGNQDFLLPLWHDQIRLPESLIKASIVVPFDGYNLLSNGAQTSNGIAISCGLNIFFDLLSDGTETSDGTQASGGYKD